MSSNFDSNVGNLVRCIAGERQGKLAIVIKTISHTAATMKILWQISGNYEIVSMFDFVSVNGHGD
jgi:muconolactone delta-isomerase